MLYEIFVALLFILAVFDCWLTNKRIKRYGTGIELNRAVNWLADYVGSEIASYALILLPTLLWVLLAKFIGTWIVILLVGMRLRFFWIQAESLIFEERIRADFIAKGIYKPKERDDSNSDHPPLSSSKEPSSPSLSLFSKGKKCLSSLKQMLTRR